MELQSERLFVIAARTELCFEDLWLLLLETWPPVSAG